MLHAPRRWRLRDLRRAGLARGLLLLGVLFMLGLQAALTAHACAMPTAMLTPGGVMGVTTLHASCADMPHRAADAVSCDGACVWQVYAPNDARPPTVPANPLVSLPPAFLRIVTPMSADVVSERYFRRRVPPPSTILLFCSLLI